jgi:hypothetical protein
MLKRLERLRWSNAERRPPAARQPKSVATWLAHSAINASPSRKTLRLAPLVSDGALAQAKREQKTQRLQNAAPARVRVVDSFASSQCQAARGVRSSSGSAGRHAEQSDRAVPFHRLRFATAMPKISGPSRNWSERGDSNSRPLAPEASALPGCATLRPTVVCRIGSCRQTGNQQRGRYSGGVRHGQAQWQRGTFPLPSGLTTRVGRR